MRSLNIMRSDRQGRKRFDGNIFTENDIFFEKMSNDVPDSFFDVDIRIHRDFSIFS